MYKHDLEQQIAKSDPKRTSCKNFKNITKDNNLQILQKKCTRTKIWKTNDQSDNLQKKWSGTLFEFADGHQIITDGKKNPSDPVSSWRLKQQLGQDNLLFQLFIKHSSLLA